MKPLGKHTRKLKEFVEDQLGKPDAIASKQKLAPKLRHLAMSLAHMADAMDANDPKVFDRLSPEDITVMTSLVAGMALADMAVADAVDADIDHQARTS